MKSILKNEKALAEDRSTDDQATSSEEKRKPELQFMQVLELIGDLGAKVFHDQHRQTWISLRGRNIRVPSAEFQRLMLRNYVDIYGKPVSKETVQRVGDYLGAGELEVLALDNRLAWRGDKLIIDLCDELWQAIEVTEEEWKLVRPQRSLFKRYGHQRPLPIPQEGGKISDVLRFLPLKNARDKILVMVWLVAAFLSHIPRPGLQLHGVQGSAKTSSADFLSMLIDPSVPCSFSLSKDSTEFIQFMDHHAIINLDNIHRLSQWASDALCRAVTGGGFSKRELYSDDNDITYEFSRTFILNGISVPSNASDLVDRSILIELERIPDSERLQIDKLRQEFEEAKPRIFGAILHALSLTMKVRPYVEQTSLPRMADWTLWGCAAADAVGIGKEQFLEAYYDAISFQHREIVASEPVCIALVAFMSDKPKWEGSPSELFIALSSQVDRQGVSRVDRWPKAANALSRRLKTLSHNLEETGFSLIFKSSGVLRTISIEKVEKCPEISSKPSSRQQSNNNDDLPLTVSSSSPDDIPVPPSNTVSNIVSDNSRKSQDIDDIDDTDGFSGNPQGVDKAQLDLSF